MQKSSKKAGVSGKEGCDWLLQICDVTRLVVSVTGKACLDGGGMKCSMPETV